MPDLSEVATGSGLVGGGAVMAVAAMKFVESWLARRRTPEQKIGDAAGAASELIRLALEASGTSVQQLLEEQRAMRGEIETLKAEVELCHAREAQSAQVNRSLIAVLRRQGIDLPADEGVGAFVELSGGEVTALMPARKIRTPADGEG